MDSGDQVPGALGGDPGYRTTFFEWQGDDTLARGGGVGDAAGEGRVFGLLMVRRHHEEGLYDTFVVDAAPAGGMLRLLSLPDQMG